MACQEITRMAEAPELLERNSPAQLSLRFEPQILKVSLQRPDLPAQLQDPVGFCTRFRHEGLEFGPLSVQLLLEGYCFVAVRDAHLLDLFDLLRP